MSFFALRRVHMIFFAVFPLVSSAIFYGSNGTTRISYVDALFMTVSASTVTGLNSVVLGSLTRWQQTLIFINMSVGSTVFVSIVTIIIRLSFFRRKFEYMVEHDAAIRHRVNVVGAEEAQLEGRRYRPYPTQMSASQFVDPTSANLPSSDGKTNSANPSPGDASPYSTRDAEKKDPNAAKKKKKKLGPLRADMITRVDVPVRVNEMNVTGWLSDKAKMEKEAGGENIGEEADRENGAVLSESPEPASPIVPPHATAIQIDDSSKPDRSKQHMRRSSDPASHLPDHHRHGDSLPIPRVKTMDYHNGEMTDSPVSAPGIRHFDRSRTIEFRDQEQNELRMRRHRTFNADPDVRRRQSQGNLREIGSRTLTRTGTYAPDALNTGFGGFPNPIIAAAGFARRRLPVFNVVERNLTMPRTTTLASVHSNLPGTDTQNVKPVSYISFDATVGRNSKFHGLTRAQQEELGGVEYRALKLLLKIVIAYWLGLQLVAVLILAPWLTYSGTYKPVFEDPQWALSPTWFVFFQVWSAFSNNGMSLVDTSMLPFQRAYLLIVVMGFLILGGNTAYPVFLRFFIWISSKVVPSQSRTRETLQFLLDHPRRCYIYLFPAHQTWFLFFVLIVLNSIDWVSFLVLDIGNPVIEAIPVGTRVIDGLLQSFAVRAAGFAIVPLADVAPALQLLYVVMMYVAVYPIAVSIRSTNVYEEKSMGVFDDGESEDEDAVEARFDKSHSATQYISYHARKQLAFDMWWLVLAVWLICIIERGLLGEDSFPEVTIFTVIFEVASAYGTVGLSLGTPKKNTSLAGVFGTLSKLVLCAVMFRGRHRGLPVAIDRSILLPSEIITAETASVRDDALSRRRGSRSSAGSANKVVSPDDGEGLEAVEPETDQMRSDRARQESHHDPESQLQPYADFAFTKPSGMHHSQVVEDGSSEEAHTSSSKEGVSDLSTRDVPSVIPSSEER